MGIDSIDRQHQKLIGMINRLVKATDLTVRSEHVSDILTEMTRYASEHFRTEEELMEEYAYPLLTEHKALHQEFRKKTLEICNATMLGVESVPQVMFNYLRDWLRNHILTEDMKYRDFFAEYHVA